MDNSAVKNLIGKKVIGFKHCFVDEKGTMQDWLIETIEAIGDDWVVTRGRHPSLTMLDNVIEGLKEEVVSEGEQGHPISESQLRSLFQRMVKSGSLAKEGWTIKRLEGYKRAEFFNELDGLRRYMHSDG